MKMFERPIPGQSLTTEPKGQPYERPPEVTDPIEALDLHLENLMEEGAMEDALHFLEFGLDLVTLVEGILRSAVMEGIHTIDTSLIIAPILHEFIKGYADEAGIDYEEGFDDKENERRLSYRRDVQKAKKMLEKSEVAKEAPKEKEFEVAMERNEDPVKPGLMARM